MNGLLAGAPPSVLDARDLPVQQAQVLTLAPFPASPMVTHSMLSPNISIAQPLWMLLARDFHVPDHVPLEPDAAVHVEPVTEDLIQPLAHPVRDSQT